jgi:hypothetical protein
MFVSELARAAAMSERALARLFAGRVGLSPERFARVVRSSTCCVASRGMYSPSIETLTQSQQRPLGARAVKELVVE